jgi:flagellar FliL protein
VKGKLKLVLPLVVLLAVAGGAYKFVLAPKPAAAKPKIAGTLVTLPREFLINLADGRYAKVLVALEVEGGAGGGHGAAPAEGTSGLPQEPAIRAVITDELTGLGADDLIQRKRRARVLKHLKEGLHASTDEHVKRVLFTDLTVQ